jgi:hypothetical protein
MPMSTAPSADQLAVVRRLNARIASPFMGASADDVAAAGGLIATDEYYDPKDATANRKQGFEWLHLIAYHLGGGESGPRVGENLVVGTTAASSWMIMIENVISSLIQDSTLKSVKLTVFPSWYDERPTYRGDDRV